MVFTVPMRNWNQNRTASILWVGKGFYSTYEELKHELLFCSVNLNFLFLQYLWGIETIKGVKLWVKDSCFYSTYEELKQMYEVINSWIEYRFYSTYEELKHRENHAFLMRGLSFYSTYEELKPRFNKLQFLRRW